MLASGKQPDAVANGGAVVASSTRRGPDAVAFSQVGGTSQGETRRRPGLKRRATPVARVRPCLPPPAPSH